MRAFVAGAAIATISATGVNGNYVNGDYAATRGAVAAPGKRRELKATNDVFTAAGAAKCQGNEGCFGKDFASMTKDEAEAHFNPERRLEDFSSVADLARDALEDPETLLSMKSFNDYIKRGMGWRPMSVEEREKQAKLNWENNLNNHIPEGEKRKLKGAYDWEEGADHVHDEPWVRAIRSDTTDGFKYKQTLIGTKSEGRTMAALDCGARARSRAS